MRYPDRSGHLYLALNIVNIVESKYSRITGYWSPIMSVYR